MKPAVAAFVEAQRAKRADSGLPAKTSDPGVYRLVDGVLAARRRSAVEAS